MEIDYLVLVVRWVHIAAVIAAIGGAMFARFAFLPAAAAELDESQRDRLREAVRKRWAKFVHLSIVTLLLTGGANFYLMVLSPRIEPMPYHALFGLKIIGAFVIFFLASALAGRSAGFENLRKNDRKWLSVMIVLGLLLVLLSGALNQIRHLSPTRTDAPTTEVTPS